MDIEFSDDAILTQTINQLPVKKLIVVSDEESVSDVCIQVLTQGERVVENQNHFMLGVVDCASAAALIHQEGAISQYAGSLAPLAFCPVETQMQTIKDAIQEMGIVPWFVLLTEEGTGDGLVSPATIFETFAQYFRQRPMIDARAYWIDVGAGMINPKPSKPGKPTCYCCPDSFGGQQPHRLLRSQITYVDGHGNKFCPFHPAQRVNPSISCTVC